MENKEAQGTNPTNICSNCGAELKEGMKFCNKCGQKVQSVNVWLMNLKDNRAEESKPADLKKSKFQFCLKHAIVGIGWVGQDPQDSNDDAFLRAESQLSSFKAGDLVWTKDPESKEYYICRITTSAVSTQNKKWHQQDISRYCKCEFFRVGPAENLPEEISPDALISRSTISHANDSVSEQTKAFFDTSHFSKVHKKSHFKRRLLVCITAVILLAAAIIVPVWIFSKEPLLPYGIEFGDDYETVKNKLPDEIEFGELIEDKFTGGLYTSFSNIPLEDIENYLSIDFQLPPDSDSGLLYFNNNEELYKVAILLTNVGESNVTKYDLQQIANYYATALDANVVDTSGGTLYNYTIENKTISVYVTITNFAITSKELEPAE